MQRILLIVLLCLLTLSPAQAQDVTPTPAPPSSLGGIAREVQQTGDVLVDLQSAVGANTFVYLIGSGLVALVIWFGLRPGMNNVSKSQQNGEAAQRDLAAANREGVAVQRELLNYLRNNDKVVERNTEAFEGVKASNDARAEAYGALTLTVHDTWTNLEAQLKRDREAGEQADMATQKQIKDVNERLDAVVELLRRIQDEIVPGGGYRKALDRAIEMVEQTKLNDTGNLPPLDTITDKDPHAPSDQK